MTEFQSNDEYNYFILLRDKTYLIIIYLLCPLVRRICNDKYAEHDDHTCSMNSRLKEFFYMPKKSP